MMMQSVRPALTVPVLSRPALPTPAAVLGDTVTLSLDPPTGLRRVAKTVGVGLLGAAFLGVPAAIGFAGGAIGVAACAVAGAAAGYLCGKHDGKAAGYCTVLFGTLATVPAAIGSFGGPIGVGVGAGLGLLLGLACDAVNRGTKPGY